jgi:hypothetical protein
LAIRPAFFHLKILSPGQFSRQVLPVLEQTVQIAANERYTHRL